MAQAATRAIEINKSADRESIIDFSPERLRAPFILRFAALCIDYIFLLILPAGWLVVSGLLSETGTLTIGNWVWLIGILLSIVNFFILPLIRGQTVGKMLVGLTILNIDGTRLSLRGVIRRHTLGYLATVLTLGIGFVISAVNSSGRSLHDFIGGTIVVHGRKKQV
jgi:uncharacterized RDD family membrane protein YckC